MADTSIQWTDSVWNPVRGCSIVSPGCHSCYAMRQAHRFDHPKGPYEGTTKIGPNGPLWTGKIILVEDKLSEPFSWKKPRRVFVNSMSDLFHDEVSFNFIDRVFGTMALSPKHTFQILTKRPERMREYMASFYREGGRLEQMMHDPESWPKDFDSDTYERLSCLDVLPNVWLGVSVEDQQRADERVLHLLQTPAAVRFLSCEPLLGPVNLEPLLQYEPFHENYKMTFGHGDFRGIDWVIAGGESGPGARPCNVSWIRSIVEQCKAAAVPVFVKQLGKSYFSGDNNHSHIFPNDRKGGDMTEWPTDLRVREFPKARR